MKTKLSAILSSLAAVAVMSFSQSAAANTCSSAGMNVVRNFCYDSGFPIRIMGRTVVAGGDVPAPPGVTQKSTCKCGKEPYVVYGYTRGMWLPTRMVEVVRNPSCSPVYGNAVKSMLEQMAKLAGTGQEQGVTQGGGDVAGGRYDTGFRHYHSWVFPLYNIYGWTPRCFARGRQLETSVAQPTRSKRDPVYMNMLYPEWMAIGNIVNNPLFNLAAHTASCVANTTGVGWGAPDDAAYWLGGCMGKNLPAAGAMSSEKNSVIGTSTILNRSLLVSNRTGGYASVSTVGDKALCSPVPVPFPSKSEFKATMLFPYSETGSGGASGSSDGMDVGGVVKQISGEVSNYLNINSRCAHRLGSSQLAWGLGRSERASNNNDSDAVYLLWRWVDCCEFN